MSKREQHKHAKDVKINIGATVYVKIYTRKDLNYKLGPKFDGPYVVREKINDNKYKLERIDSKKVISVHKNNIKGGDVEGGKRVSFSETLEYIC